MQRRTTRVTASVRGLQSLAVAIRCNAARLRRFERPPGRGLGGRCRAPVAGQGGRFGHPVRQSHSRLAAEASGAPRPRYGRPWKASGPESLRANSPPRQRGCRGDLAGRIGSLEACRARARRSSWPRAPRRGTGANGRGTTPPLARHAALDETSAGARGSRPRAGCPARTGLFPSGTGGGLQTAREKPEAGAGEEPPGRGSESAGERHSFTPGDPENSLRAGIGSHSSRFAPGRKTQETRLRHEGLKKRMRPCRPRPPGREDAGRPKGGGGRMGGEGGREDTSVDPLNSAPGGWGGGSEFYRLTPAGNRVRTPAMKPQDLAAVITGTLMGSAATPPPELENALVAFVSAVAVYLLRLLAGRMTRGK